MDNARETLNYPGWGKDTLTISTPFGDDKNSQLAVVRYLISPGSMVKIDGLNLSELVFSDGKSMRQVLAENNLLS